MKAFFIFPKKSRNTQVLKEFNIPDLFGVPLDHPVSQEEAEKLLGQFSIVSPCSEPFNLGYRDVYASMRGPYNPDASALCNTFLYGTVIFSK